MIKVLIVDDERIVRDGLKVSIDWEKYDCTICGEASDGLEGLHNIFTLNPDLVLLDMRMPGIYGYELAENARKQGFKGKFIILSGYSDFVYAKSAIQSGVIAYLLKPVDEDELIEAICRARDQLDDERLISVYGSQSAKQMKQVLIGNLITGKIMWKQGAFEEYNLDFSSNAFQLVYFDFNSYTSFSKEEWLDKIRETCESIQYYDTIIDEKVFVLLLGKQSISEFPKAISPFFPFLIHSDVRSKEKNKESFFNFPITFLSTITFTSDEIPELYAQVNRTVEKAFIYLRDEPVIYCDLVNERMESSTDDFVKAVENLYVYVSTGQEEKVGKVLEEIEALIRFKEMMDAKAMQIIINCYSQIKNLMCQKNPDLNQKIRSEMAVINELCHLHTLHQMINYLKKQFVDIISMNDISDGTISKKVKEYVDKNYQSTVLLTDLGDIFGYNSAYLGKVFKKEVGLSFHSYLENVRIEKAKLLLKKDVKIYDAAIQCGFKDLEYFSKKFKAIVGCSPSIYREQQSE